MTLHLRFLLASLALGAMTLVRAESDSAPRSPARAPSPLLAALDLDRDGMLSADEIAAAPVALTALDLDEDGIISAEERSIDAAGRPVRTRRDIIALLVVTALDANHDGVLQALEIAQAASSLKRLDLNGDGHLIPNELRTVMVARN